MVRARVFITQLKGWRRWLFCLAMGALTTAALPPLHAIPLLLISFPALIWLIQSSPRLRDALSAGWWFGFGHFTIGFYWLANAFLVDAARFAWLIPAAVLGLPALLALFPAIASALCWRIRRRGVAGVITFALLWTAMEWLRGHMLTGFPWNLIGYSWTFSDEISQLAATVGIYGLSLIALTVFGIPALLGDNGGFRLRLVPQLVAIAAVAAIWGYGYLRLAAAPRYESTGIIVRLVQANIPQADKWRADRREPNFRRFVELSKGDGGPRPRVIVWPETAVPFFLSREIGRRQTIAQLVERDGFVVTGAPRISPTGASQLQIWNSVVVIDHRGAIVATYDKAHLVPFGEYLPLRGIFSRLGIDKLVYGPVDYSAGLGPRTLRLGSLPPVGPLICYEGIFPGSVTDPTNRPAWLLNVSNDGWYGISAGPHQHFAMARLRSVEEGLPLVRAANTGISGVVDSFGRVIARLELGESGFVDADLPQPVDFKTIYGQYGDLVVLPLALILVAIGFFSGVMTGTARHD